MDRAAYASFVNQFRGKLQMNPVKATRSSSGVITPVVRAGLTIRLLAGDDPLDLMCIYEVVPSLVRAIFHETVDFINSTLRFPGI